MKYENNGSIRQAIKEAVAAEGITLSAVAAKINRPPQAINNLFLKKAITFPDVADLADVLGYDLFFALIKRDPGTGE